MSLHSSRRCSVMCKYNKMHWRWRICCCQWLYENDLNCLNPPENSGEAFLPSFPPKPSAVKTPWRRNANYDMQRLSSAVYILPAILFARQEAMERKREACKSDESICPLEAQVLNNRGVLLFKCLSWCRRAFDLFCSTRKTTGISVWWIWHTEKGVDGNLKGLRCLSLSLAWTANVCLWPGNEHPWTAMKLLTGVSRHRIFHFGSCCWQSKQTVGATTKKVMRSDTPMVWEWTSMEVLTGPIKSLGLVECQLHASKSRQPQKSCCLIRVLLSPWQSETDNEEAPLLLLFCQKELEQSKRKAERRRWRCGELSQRHKHTHAELWICHLNPFFFERFWSVH